MKTTLQAAVAATLAVAAPLFSQTPEPAAPAGEPAAAAPGPVEMNKVSYFIGTNIGGQMKSQGIKIDLVELAAGLKDALEGAKPKYPQEQLASAMQAFEAEMQAKAQVMQAQEAKKFEAAKAEGEKFLAENKKREGVTTTSSGLQYEVIKKADGAKPAATDQVKVHYHGTLVDGKVFDSSVDRGEPVTFPVQGVIKGWVEALQLMPVGSKWKLFIPSDLAYGKQGAGADIGPDSALVFEVELIEIVK
jgi:FKBP-type peptidyl-prolyl cis-trans isomerase